MHAYLSYDIQDSMNVEEHLGFYSRNLSSCRSPHHPNTIEKTKHHQLSNRIIEMKTPEKKTKEPQNSVLPKLREQVQYLHSGIFVCDL